MWSGWEVFQQPVRHSVHPILPASRLLSDAAGGRLQHAPPWEWALARAFPSRKRYHADFSRHQEPDACEMPALSSNVSISRMSRCEAA